MAAAAMGRSGKICLLFYGTAEMPAAAPIGSASKSLSD
jgi:hypothetical protein